MQQSLEVRYAVCSPALTLIPSYPDFVLFNIVSAAATAPGNGILLKELFSS